MNVIDSTQIQLNELVDVFPFIFSFTKKSLIDKLISPRCRFQAASGAYPHQNIRALCSKSTIKSDSNDTNFYAQKID